MKGSAVWTTGQVLAGPNSHEAKDHVVNLLKNRAEPQDLVIRMRHYQHRAFQQLMRLLHCTYSTLALDFILLTGRVVGSPV